MKRLFIFITSIAAFVACSKDYDGFETLELNAGLDEGCSTKVELDNLDSPFSSLRTWIWQEGDKANLTYRVNGKDWRVESSSIEISPLNSSSAKFTFRVPKAAVISGFEYGSSEAFGKTVSGSSKTIPSEMVYATGDVQREQGSSAFAAITLSHQCSYLYLDPDNLYGCTITNYSLTGTSLKGGTGSETIDVPFADYTTDGVWVAVSNKATDVTAAITLSVGSTVSMSIGSTGNGTCRLIQVKYKVYIDYE